ncbi:MAG: LysR family transcriptional regulator, partial [Lysobacteraceae bacterium]
LVAETEQPFARIEQSFAAVRDLASTPRGLVRITAPVALGRQHIAPLLGPFLLAQPEIRIELDLTDRFVNLAQEGFDLAIRHVHAPPDTHVAWTLCDTRSLLVASPAYLARRGMPTHPRELAEHDCLLYLRPGAGQNWTFERAPARRGIAPVTVAVDGPFKANNSEALREAALAGLGLGLLPDFSAGRPADGLVPVLPGWRPHGFFAGQIHAIRPWSPQVPRAVQCVVEHLRQSLAGGFAA